MTRPPEQFAIKKISSDDLPGRMGVWEVSGASNNTYQVTIYDPDGKTATCDCPSYRIHRNLCKHIRAVYAELATK